MDKIGVNISSTVSTPLSGIPAYKTAAEDTAIPSQDIKDTCDISSEPEKPKKLSAKVKKVVKKAADKVGKVITKVNDVKFELTEKAFETLRNVKNDPKSALPILGKVALAAAVVAGASVVTALVAGPAIADSPVSEVVKLGTRVAQGGGVTKKVKLYNDIADFVGVGSQVCVLGGASVVALQGATKVASGVKNIGKGKKQSDKLKMTKGVRTTVNGSRKTLTAAAIATLGAGGTAGVVGGVVRKAVMPALRKVNAGLNLGIGAKNLVDGIKGKDKKKIISGLVDVAYGVAVTASILGGGVPAAVASAVLLQGKVGIGFYNAHQAEKAKRAKAAEKALENAKTPNNAEKTAETSKNNEVKESGIPKDPVSETKDSQASKVVKDTDTNNLKAADSPEEEPFLDDDYDFISEN